MIKVVEQDYPIGSFMADMGDALMKTPIYVNISRLDDEMGESREGFWLFILMYHNPEGEHEIITGFAVEPEKVADRGEMVTWIKMAANYTADWMIDNDKVSRQE